MGTRQPRNSKGQFASSGGGGGGKKTRVLSAPKSHQSILKRVAANPVRTSNDRAIRLAKRISRSTGESVDAILKRAFKDA